MPRLILYILFMLLITPTTTLAKTNVEISNNLDGSKNTVHVDSNTSQQSYSNSVQGTTDIRINNNGEIKEYHGSDGNIDIKSDDGKSSVSVNTTGASNNTAQSTSSVNTKTNITVNSNTDSSPSSIPEGTVAGIFKDNTVEPETEAGLWAFLKKEMAELFSFFKH